jgi:hypothetical protein
MNKTVTIVMVLTLIVLSLSVREATADKPDKPGKPERLHAKDATFIIGKTGNKTYVLNGTDGQLLSSNTSAVVVFQYHQLMILQRHSIIVTIFTFGAKIINTR